MAEIPEDDLVDLFIHSITGQLTESGRQELADWAQSSLARKQLYDEMHDPVRASAEMAVYTAINPREAYVHWQRKQRAQRRQQKRRQRKQPGQIKQLYIRIGVAVVVFGVLFAIWLVKSDIPKETASPAPADTMALVARSIENNTTLSIEGNNRTDTMRILPDGTKVWLNADSKIFYPARFTGSERVVELKGEGYFEVARNPQRPFVVKLTDGTRIKELGTSFDVMAYPEEDSITTTLITGAVYVKKGDDSVLLKPGQQVTGAKNGAGIWRLKKVDGVKFAEWKDNVFFFPEHSNLKMVLGRLARWYHLRLTYKVNISDQQECSGEIQRDLPVEQVLDLLKYKGIQFTVSDGELIVEPEGATS